MAWPAKMNEQERLAALEAALREIANIVNVDNNPTLAGAITIATKAIERICT
jgi:hypothetical protein